MTTRALVLADTHIPGDRLDRLPEAVWRAAATADVILHAGDVTSAELLDELERHAPLHAVLGNNDRDLGGRLPVELRLEIDGVAVAMLHDTGPRRGRAERMARRFPEAQVLVFGHSHDPVDEPTPTGPRLFNPGSPTQRRRAPHRSHGWLDLDAGRVVSSSIVRIRPGAVPG